MLKRGRKGQITLFIILGVILLFSTALVIFIKNKIAQVPLEEVRTQVEEVPLSVQPVQKFVSSCLEQATNDALQLVGAHGGYIGTTPDAFKYTQKVFFYNPLDNTESEVVAYSPRSSYRIPYWYYMSSPNNDLQNFIFKSERPELYLEQDSRSSVESQMASYVSDSVVRCVSNGKDSLAESGYNIVEKGYPDVRIFVRDNEVTSFMKYPVAVKTAGSEITVSQYSSSAPSHLKKMYDLASEIVTAESNSSFIEHHAQTLISVYSLGRAANKLPPIYDFDFKFGSPVVWVKPDVDSRLKSILSSYMPLLTIPGTGTYKASATDNKYENALFGFATLPPILKNKYFGDIDVSFGYNEWLGLYSKYKCPACSEGAILPDSFGIAIIVPIGFQNYQTLYDISFPVIVELTDKSLPDAYTFRFALEANMRNTEPVNRTTVIPSSVVGSLGSLTCSPSQRTSGDVTINTEDGFTHKPLDNVQISYVCGDTCYIGSTKVSDGGASLTTSLPPCIAGGRIIPLKNGYAGSAISYNAQKGVGGEVTLPLFKEVEKPVEAKKYSSGRKDVEGNFPLSLQAEKLANKEELLVLARGVGGPAANGFVSFADIGNKESTMKLVPGTYELSLMLMYQGSAYVPKSTIQVPGTLFQKSKEFPVDAVHFNDTLFEGMLIFNNETGYWELTPEQLYNSNKIIFKAAALLPIRGGVLEKNGVLRLNRDFSDMMNLGNGNNISIKYRDLLNPMVS